jgi:hypothetical protein
MISSFWMRAVWYAYSWGGFLANCSLDRTATSLRISSSNDCLPPVATPRCSSQVSTPRAKAILAVIQWLSLSEHRWGNLSERQRPNGRITINGLPRLRIGGIRLIGGIQIKSIGRITYIGGKVGGDAYPPSRFFRNRLFAM